MLEKRIEGQQKQNLKRQKHIDIETDRHRERERERGIHRGIHR